VIERRMPILQRVETRSPKVAGESIQRLVVLGYITAVAMPPVGLIMGIVLAVRLTKPSARQGLWIIVVSIVAVIGWVIAVATGLLDPNSTTST
jgi:hypothetical protein